MIFHQSLISLKSFNDSTVLTLTGYNNKLYNLNKASSYVIFSYIYHILNIYRYALIKLYDGHYA